MTKSDPMAGFSIILHPTDLSDDSMAAFRVACRIAREGTRIIVLHVMEDSLVSREGYLETLNRRLRELESPCPGVTLEIRLAEGHPVDEILRAAEDVSCGLIVMGNHGRSGLFQRLMGGVGEAVLRRSRFPVLMVKSQPSEAAPADGLSGAGARKGFVHVF